MVRMWRSATAVATVAVGLLAVAPAAQAARATPCRSLAREKAVRIEVQRVNCRTGHAVIRLHARSATRRGSCSQLTNGRGLCSVRDYQCFTLVRTRRETLVTCTAPGERKVDWHYRR